jgi:cytochrome c oxidase cbb3-type subunit 1
MVGTSRYFLSLAPCRSRNSRISINAVIFAFGGSALFASSYHIVQRTCHVRLISDKLASFTFWGWQLVIVLAAIIGPLNPAHH